MWFQSSLKQTVIGFKMKQQKEQARNKIAQKLTKNEAKRIFQVAHHWDKQKLNIQIPKTKMNRYEFERYDFKKYRLLMWVLAKMKVVPYTFYIKYCK